MARTPTPASATCRGTASGGASPDAHRQPWHFLVTLAVVVSAGRWLFAADRRTFHLVPDELAVAGMARWFSRTAGWNMLDSNTWQPGYSVVLAPLFWLVDSPVGVYRAMIVTNAVFGGVAAIQLALLLRRTSALTHAECIVISGLVSLMPSAMSATAHVWAEPLVSVLFLATVSTSITALNDLRPSRLHAPIAIAALAYLAHGRMLPLLPVTVGLAVATAYRRGLWRHVPIAVGAGAIGYISVRSFSNWVFGRVWEAQQTENTVGNTVARVRHLDEVLDAFAGQVWYLLTSTALLAALGFIELVRAAARPAAHAPLARGAPRVTLGLLLPLIATSAVFVSDRSRPDQLVYGRYNDAVLPLVVGLGAAWLVRTARTGTLTSLVRPLGASALITVQLGFFIWQFHAKQLDEGEALKPMIAGIAPVLGESTTVPVLRVTAVAVVTMTVLLASAWWARAATRRLAAVAFVLVVVAAAATHRSFEPRRNDLASASEVTTASEVLVDAGTVGVALIPSFAEPSVPLIHQLSYSLAYQWYLPTMAVRVDTGLDDRVGPYVFSPDNDSLLVARGGTIIWEDAERNMALWKEPDGSD